jgi:hypothetical protein
MKQFLSLVAGKLSKYKQIPYFLCNSDDRFIDFTSPGI